MSITLSSAAPRAQAVQAASPSSTQASASKTSDGAEWSNLVKGTILGGITGVVVGAGLLMSGVANSNYFLNGRFAGSSLNLRVASIVGGASIAAGAALGAGVGVVLDH